MTEGTIREARRLTEDQLAMAGCSAEEITRLKAQRSQYHPMIEFVESGDQLDRLRFLRWLYQQGFYQFGPEAERRES